MKNTDNFFINFPTPSLCVEFEHLKAVIVSIEQPVCPGKSRDEEKSLRGREGKWY